MNSIETATRYTDRDLIEAIVGNFYILDYGYITKVNADKTINVTHCTKLVSRSGDTLPETTTKNLEVLTVSGAGFSVNFDYAPGDKVLLLGLKNLVKDTSKAGTAKQATVYYHYTRETMKAIPLCAFDSSAKVKLEVEKGTLKVTTQGKIELNGNTKQFVTWSELNQALSQFASSLSISLNGAVYVTPAGTPAPLGWAAGTPPSSINISAAKTTTVVTGG